jgi:hypothetical protein
MKSFQEIIKIVISLAEVYEFISFKRGAFLRKFVLVVVSTLIGFK